MIIKKTVIGHYINTVNGNKITVTGHYINTVDDNKITQSLDTISIQSMVIK